MTSQDSKGQHNGAYSAQYQMMEQERLRRLHDEHYQATVSMRSRAQVLSKQTIQRKKALEQKKLAMARAEEERRRHALEERRKTQQQATDRFRNAIYRNFRPIATNKPLKSSSVETTNPSKVKQDKEDKITLGYSVKLEIHQAPSLDEVLDTIRGGTRKKIELSCEEMLKKIELSCEEMLIQPSFTIETPSNQTTPTKILFPVSPQTNYHHSSPPTDLLEESTISSTNSSLHDSLDTPPLSPSSSMTKQKPLHQILDLTTITSPSPETTPIATPTQEEKKIVGILKKPFELVDGVSSSTTISSSVSTVISRSSKSNSASGMSKKVRFVDEYCKHGSRSPPKMITRNGFLIPNSPSNGCSKMRISLGHSPQKHKGHKNGITLQVPHSINEDEQSHTPSPRSISPQTLTLPVDKTVLERTPTDEEINMLWKHINAYLHHTKSSEDIPTRESPTPQLTRSIRCRNSHQPVKLWRRHALQQEDQPRQAFSAPALNNEEYRLLESIEVLNEKLKGRGAATKTKDGTDIKKTFSSHSLNELPRTRVRYHPKTVLQTTPTSRQYLQYR